LTGQKASKERGYPARHLSAEFCRHVAAVMNDAAHDNLIVGRVGEDDVLADGQAAQPRGQVVARPAQTGRDRQVGERVPDPFGVPVGLDFVPHGGAIPPDGSKVTFRLGRERQPTA
jgi:hypothetical protein